MGNGIRFENEKEFEHANRLVDKTGEANYALWNSLLTSNALVLAAGAFVATPQQISQYLLIGILGAVSAGGVCLIWNFRSTQKLYLDLGTDFANILAGREVSRNTDDAAKDHDRIRFRENVALFAMGLSLFLILAMILCP